MADTDARYPGNPERVYKVSRVREADIEAAVHSTGHGTPAGFLVNAFPNVLRLRRSIHRLWIGGPTAGRSPPRSVWVPWSVPSPTHASTPIRHGGIFATLASTCAFDHFCRSTIAPCFIETNDVE